MAVRNLVFLRNLLSMSKAFGTAIFWACCGCPKPVLFPRFGAFRANNLRSAEVSRRGFPDAQDLHLQHHQDCIVAMNLSLFFADTSGVYCFKRCWNWPVRGLGGAK